VNKVEREFGESSLSNSKLETITKAKQKAKAKNKSKKAKAQRRLLCCFCVVFCYKMSFARTILSLSLDEFA